MFGKKQKPTVRARLRTSPDDAMREACRAGRISLKITSISESLTFSGPNQFTEAGIQEIFGYFSGPSLSYFQMTYIYPKDRPPHNNEIAGSLSFTYIDRYDYETEMMVGTDAKIPLFYIGIANADLYMKIIDIHKSHLNYGVTETEVVLQTEIIDFSAIPETERQYISLKIQKATVWHQMSSTKMQRWKLPFGDRFHSLIDAPRHFFRDIDE